MLKISRYFALSVAAVIFLFGAFMLLGFQDVAGWRFGIRNMLGVFVMLFLAQVFTGRDLTRPAWRPMLPLVFLGLWAYSSIIAASDSEAARMEAMNGYILTFLGGVDFYRTAGNGRTSMEIFENTVCCL